MGRMLVMWLLTSGMVGVFFYIFSTHEKVVAIKMIWRVLTALIVGAVLVSLPLVLNNIQGM